MAATNQPGSQDSMRVFHKSSRHQATEKTSLAISHHVHQQEAREKWSRDLHPGTVSVREQVSERWFTPMPNARSTFALLLPFVNVPLLQQEKLSLV